MAVKKPPLLLTMKLVVRHIQVQHNLFRASRVAAKERVHEKLLDALLVGDDLLCPDAFEKPFIGFQSVQRAFPRAGLALVPLMSSALPTGITLATELPRRNLSFLHRSWPALSA